MENSKLLLTIKELFNPSPNDIAQKGRTKKAVYYPHGRDTAKSE
jgi:hypothetical protein